MCVAHSPGGVQHVVPQSVASALFTLAAVSVGEPPLGAQPSSTGTNLLVPIAGVADLGGIFTGALLIERFSAQRR
jgi:hypothetical protein